MKEAIVRLGPRVELHNVPIPTPSADEVLIQVIVSGTNPKDFKMADWGMGEYNTGDDIAGVVHATGSDVTEFHVGDRVAAMHRLRAPHGSYAEYALAPAHTTFHIPKHTSFEEAATIPLAAMTAAVGLFVRMNLPQPFVPASKPLPLLIYGAASAVGAFAIKLASRSNIHPLICVAGKGAAFVESLIDRSKGDVIIDYRLGDAAVINSINSSLAPNHTPLTHAFDCVSAGTSYLNCSAALTTPGSHLTMVLRIADHVFPAHIAQSTTNVGSVQHDTTYEGAAAPDDGAFGFAWYRMFALGLQQGWLAAHPFEIVPGGLLGGVERALGNLKKGRASAVKYVVRIAETEGLGG